MSLTVTAGFIEVVSPVSFARITGLLLGACAYDLHGEIRQPRSDLTDQRTDDPATTDVELTPRCCAGEQYCIGYQGRVIKRRRQAGRLVLEVAGVLRVGGVDGARLNQSHRDACLVSFQLHSQGVRQRLQCMLGRRVGPLLDDRTISEYRPQVDDYAAATFTQVSSSNDTPVKGAEVVHVEGATMVGYWYLFDSPVCRRGRIVYLGVKPTKAHNSHLGETLHSRLICNVCGYDRDAAPFCLKLGFDLTQSFEIASSKYD